MNQTLASWMHIGRVATPIVHQPILYNHYHPTSLLNAFCLCDIPQSRVQKGSVTLNKGMSDTETNNFNHSEGNVTEGSLKAAKSAFIRKPDQDSKSAFQSF